MNMENDYFINYILFIVIDEVKVQGYGKFNFSVLVKTNLGYASELTNHRILKQSILICPGKK